MADLPRYVSALADSAEAFARASGEAVSIAEAPALTLLNLRSDSSDQAFRDAMFRALGFVPGNDVGTVTSGEGCSTLVLGPDEWLLVVAGADGTRMSMTVRQALQGLYMSLVDVSHSRAVILLSGCRAHGVLQKGIGLDLHPRAFYAGRCAQTVMARMPILLEQTGDSPDYRIYVRASFAAHLSHWLIDAMQEFNATD